MAPKRPSSKQPTLFSSDFGSDAEHDAVPAVPEGERDALQDDGPRALESRPELYETLRRSRVLPLVLDICSTDLRTRHLGLQDRLWQSRPESEPTQIASEALEIALQEFEAQLPSEPPPTGTEPLSLDAAMAYIRNPSRTE